MTLFFRLWVGCMVQMLPFAFLCFYPFQKHYRFSVKAVVRFTGTLIAGLGIHFAAVCMYLKSVFPVSQLLFDCANLTFVLCLIPCFLWYFYAVEEIWQKKVFIFVFTVTCALAMTSIGNVLETYLYMDSSDGLPYYGTAILTLSLLTAVTLPLLLLLLKHFYLPVSDGLQKKESFSLCLLSVLLFVVLGCGLIPLNYGEMFHFTSLTLFALLLFSVFVIYAVIFRILYESHENLLVQEKLAELRYELELNEEQYKRIWNSVESSRRFRHDFRHHCLAMDAYLKEGNDTQARKYLADLMQIQEEEEQLKLCRHTVINAVVLHYKRLAEASGIRFHCRIMLPEIVSVRDSDLAVLLGNLLENALTGAADAPEDNRYVDLNIITSGRLLAITIDNGFNGVVKAENGQYFSTKKDHTGLGLRSIEAISQCYDGGVDFQDAGGIFHSSVMLNMGKRE